MGALGAVKDAVTALAGVDGDDHFGGLVGI